MAPVEDQDPAGEVMRQAGQLSARLDGLDPASARVKELLEKADVLDKRVADLEAVEGPADIVAALDGTAAELERRLQEIEQFMATEVAVSTTTGGEPQRSLDQGFAAVEANERTTLELERRLQALEQAEDDETRRGIKAAEAAARKAEELERRLQALEDSGAAAEASAEVPVKAANEALEATAQSLTQRLDTLERAAAASGAPRASAGSQATAELLAQRIEALELRGGPDAGAPALQARLSEQEALVAQLQEELQRAQAAAPAAGAPSVADLEARLREAEAQGRALLESNAAFRARLEAAEAAAEAAAKEKVVETGAAPANAGSPERPAPEAAETGATPAGAELLQRAVRDRETLRREVEALREQQAAQAGAVPLEEHNAAKREVQRMQEALAAQVAQAQATVSLEEYNASKREIERLQQALAKEAARPDAVSLEEYSVSRREIERLQQALAKQAAQPDAVPAEEHAALRMEVESLRQAAAMASAPAEADGQAQYLEEANDQLRAQLAESEQVAAAAEKQRDSLEESVERLQQSLERQAPLAQPPTEVKNLQALNETLQGQLRSKEEQCQSQAMQIAGLQRQLQDVRVEVDGTKRVVAMARQKQEPEAAQVVASEGTAAQVQSLNEAVQGLLNDEKRQTQELQSELKQLRVDLASAKQATVPPIQPTTIVDQLKAPLRTEGKPPLAPNQYNPRRLGNVPETEKAGALTTRLRAMEQQAMTKLLEENNVLKSQLTEKVQAGPAFETMRRLHAVPGAQSSGNGKSPSSSVKFLQSGSRSVSAQTTASPLSSALAPSAAALSRAPRRSLTSIPGVATSPSPSPRVGLRTPAMSYTLERALSPSPVIRLSSQPGRLLESSPLSTLRPTSSTLQPAVASPLPRSRAITSSTSA